MTLARARANGAISVVNAIVTGRWGGSLGIDLHTEAKVTLLEDVPEVEVLIDGEEANEEGILARLCVKAVLARLGQPDWGGRVETTSNIPSSRGLKSSSAAANAVVLATNHAFHLYEGRALPRAILLDAAIEAALDAGVTITGAFDDASASMDGGVVITDNQQRVVMHREEVDETHKAILLVPASKTPTASVRDLPYAPFRGFAEQAHLLARQGHWQQAMTLNGLYAGALYGVPATWTRDALSAGAVGAGVSGTGPAFAAVAPPEHADAVRKALAEHAHAHPLPGAQILTANLTNRRAEALP